jgi:hypothetical protein
VSQGFAFNEPNQEIVPFSEPQTVIVTWRVFLFSLTRYESQRILFGCTRPLVCLCPFDFGQGDFIRAASLEKAEHLPSPITRILSPYPAKPIASVLECFGILVFSSHIMLPSLASVLDHARMQLNSVRTFQSIGQPLTHFANIRNCESLYERLGSLREHLSVDRKNT